MLARVEADQALAVAMDDGIGGDHFGVEARAFGKSTVEHAAMPVRPIHHGGD